MINFFKLLFNKKYNTGVCLDTRTYEQRNLDWTHEEIATGKNESLYVLKDDFKLKNYPAKDQKSTYSCMAHACAFALGVENELETGEFKDLSPAFFYRHRLNFPNPGMILADAGSISKKIGCCLNFPLGIDENTFNNLIITTEKLEEASEYSTDGYISIQNSHDIDTINSVSSSGKAVPIVIYATYKEWASEYPVATDDFVTIENAPIRHAVTVFPQSGFIDKLGVKYLPIKDSAPFGGFSVRYLSEDFISKRCYGAMYFINKPNKRISHKPIYTFRNSMRFGERSEDVKMLQKCLRYDKYFDFEPSGYYGAITANAVLKFQKEHGIQPESEIEELKGRLVGQKTLSALNKRFSK